MAPLLSNEHYNFDKVLSIVNLIGRKVLYWCFLHGCSDKSLNENLRDYLIRKNWTSTSVNKVFNKTMLFHINNDPTCSSFDISLLFVVISKCCDSIEPNNWKNFDSFEGLVKKIKDFRNDIMHGNPSLSDNTTIQHIKSCKEIFEKLIEETHLKYGIAATDKNIFWTDVDKNIMELENAVRGEKEIILTLERNLTDQITHGTDELKTLYKQWSKVIPVFFLDGFDDFEVEVDSVFTEIEITEAGRKEKGDKIECKDILGDDENIILIEGQAGSGKTTLLKYFLSAWIKDDSNTEVEKLHDFDLVVFFECRNRSMHSLSDLLTYILPNTIKHYNMIDVPKIIKGIKVLFLIDGIDEINSNSLKVVREIMDFNHKQNILIVCTSRPSDLKNFYKMKPSSAKLKHFRLDGVPSNLHEVFVERLHKHLGGASKLTDTAMLVQYIRKSPQTIRVHFKFPLNLTLITSLWIISPEKLNRVTTVSTLYIELLDLVTEKLVERLKKNQSCMDYSVDDLKEAALIAYQSICHMAYCGMIKKQFILTEGDVTSMKSFCKSIETDQMSVKLPVAEVLGAYLATKHTWTSRDSKIQYSYPHRSFQEHMAAEDICNKICTTNFNMNELMSSLESSYSNINGYTDLFPHLLGMMAFKGEDMLHSNGVELVDELRNSKVKNESGGVEWWLDLLSEADNDEVIALACASAIAMDNWMIGDKNVKSASAVLKCSLKYPTKFVMLLFSHPDHLDGLVDLLTLIAQSETILDLSVFHNFWHPKYGSTDEVADIVFNGRCVLEGFVGHLKRKENLGKLPPTLMSLRLAVSTKESLTTSLVVLHELKNLKNLGVYILAGLPLYLMKPPLPSQCAKVDLLFGDITDKYTIWLVNAAINLHPTQGYEGISVVGTVTLDSTSGHYTAGGDGLSLQGYENLLKYLDSAVFGGFQMSTSLPGQYKMDDISAHKEVSQSSTLSASSSISSALSLPSSALTSFGMSPNPAQSTFRSPSKIGMNPISASPSSNPFKTNNLSTSLPKQHRPFSFAILWVWSFIFTDEDRKKALALKTRTNHKPMKEVPW